MKANKINILHIINSIDYGGAEYNLIDTLNNFTSSRFDVHLIYLQGGGFLSDDIVNNNVRVNDFSNLGKFSLFSFFKIISYVKENKIDIIHTHLVQASLIGRIIALITFRRCITSRHYVDYSSLSNLTYWVEDKLIKYSTSIICVSDAVKNYLLSIGVKNKKIKVIHNGIRTSEIKVSKTKFSNSDIIRCGTICRLVDEKGIDIMINAMSLLISKYKNIRLEIIGDGKKYEMLNSLIQSKKMENYVYLLGSSPRYECLEKMVEWDMYLNSSRNESFGISVIEAMSIGKAVIAPRVGGLPEIIIDRHNGLLYDLSEENLVKKVEILINDNHLRNKISVNAVNDVKSSFTIDKQIKKIENLYGSLMGSEDTSSVI